MVRDGRCKKRGLVFLYLFPLKQFAPFLETILRNCKADGHLERDLGPLVHPLLPPSSNALLIKGKKAQCYHTPKDPSYCTGMVLSFFSWAPYSNILLSKTLYCLVHECHSLNLQDKNLKAAAVGILPFSSPSQAQESITLQDFPVFLNHEITNREKVIIWKLPDKVPDGSKPSSFHTFTTFSSCHSPSTYSLVSFHLFSS